MPIKIGCFGSRLKFQWSFEKNSLLLSQGGTYCVLISGSQLCMWSTETRAFSDTCTSSERTGCLDISLLIYNPRCPASGLQCLDISSPSQSSRPPVEPRYFLVAWTGRFSLPDAQTTRAKLVFDVSTEQPHGQHDLVSVLTGHGSTGVCLPEKDEVVQFHIALVIPSPLEPTGSRRARYPRSPSTLESGEDSGMRGNLCYLLGELEVKFRQARPSLVKPDTWTQGGVDPSFVLHTTFCTLFYSASASGMMMW